MTTTDQSRYPGPRIREVYAEYALGRIPFEAVIQAAEARIAWRESTRGKEPVGEPSVPRGT